MGVVVDYSIFVRKRSYFKKIILVLQPGVSSIVAHCMARFSLFYTVQHKKYSWMYITINLFLIYLTLTKNLVGLLKRVYTN
jgi:hypothetical protein